MLTDWSTVHKVSNFRKNRKSQSEVKLTFSQILQNWHHNNANDSVAFRRQHLTFSILLVAYERPLNPLGLDIVDQTIFDAMIRQEIKFCQHLRSIVIGGKTNLAQTLVDSATVKIGVDLISVSEIMENILGMSPIEVTT